MTLLEDMMEKWDVSESWKEVLIPTFTKDVFVNLSLREKMDAMFRTPEGCVRVFSEREEHEDQTLVG